MKKCLAACAAVAVVALSAVGAAHASVLYTDGPINFNAAAVYYIGPGSEVTDSFALTGASTVTGVEFGASGASPSSVDWKVSQGANVYGQGTASASSTYVGTNQYQYNIYEATFSIPSITLASGTYYLTLTNASGVSWEPSTGGPSSACHGADCTIFPESFSILGSPAGVPEPSTWAMLILGVGMIGFRARRRSQRMRAAA